MKNNEMAKARRRGARPVCFDGRFIGCTEKSFRELRAVAKQARQSYKEEGGVLQGLQVLRNAYAVIVGRGTQGHRNLRAAVAHQKAKTGFYRELWHAASAAAERTVTPVSPPLTPPRATKHHQNYENKK